MVSDRVQSTSLRDSTRRFTGENFVSVCYAPRVPVGAPSAFCFLQGVALAAGRFPSRRQSDYPQRCWKSLRRLGSRRRPRAFTRAASLADLGNLLDSTRSSRRGRCIGVGRHLNVQYMKLTKSSSKETDQSGKQAGERTVAAACWTVILLIKTFSLSGPYLPTQNACYLELVGDTGSTGRPLPSIRSPHRETPDRAPMP